MSRVNDARNAYGSWTLRWRPDTPLAIRAAAATDKYPFSLIRIYAAPIDPGLVGTVQGLWTGLLMRSDPDSIGGFGPTWLAGSPGGSIWTKRDGTGPYTSANIAYGGTTDGTLTQWLTSLLSQTVSGLTVGYVGPTFRTYHGGTIGAHTVRTVLDSFLAVVFDVEWRINDRFQVDIGYADQLYPATDVPLATREGGRDPQRTVVAATDLGLSTDWSDWIGSAVVRSGGFFFSSASSSVRKNPATGANFNYRHIADTDGQTNTEAGYQATRRFIESGRVRSADISAREYDLPSRLLVGSSVDVWDPVEGFYDMSQTVEHRGEQIHPVRLRVHAVDWPILEGMGVWLDRRNITGDTTDLIDLTPYVDWEAPDADTRLTVGAPPRTLGSRR